METDVPENIDDLPAAIEEARVHLSEITQKLERLRRNKRNLKIEYKMEAREADGPSNRTERKAYVKDQKQGSETYQEILDEIDELSHEQARTEGHLERLKGEFEIRLQRMKDLPSIQNVN